MKPSFRRWAALLAVFAMIVAACSSEATDNPTTTTAPEDVGGQTGTTQAPDDPATGADDNFELSIAIFEDLTTDNFWAYLDPENSVWNAYVFGNQAPALFQYASPTLQLVPQVSDDLPSEPIQDGDVWKVTQTLKQGLTWSDGEAITTDDIVFTFETVRDLALGGQWFSSYPIASEDDPATEESEALSGLTAVTAIDDYTIEYTFNQTPGLSLWQFGVGLAPILPEHFWADAVANANEAGDLYAASGLGAPGMWAYDFTEREPGAFARNSANTAYPLAGSTTKIYDDGTYEFSADGIDEQFYGDGSGAVEYEYTEGPFATDVTYSIYTDQNAAVLALTNGEVDFMLNSLGLQRGLQSLVLAEPSLDIVVNPANSYRYLAFNTRKFPMSEVAFRQAIGCMVDKDFMANNVLQGSALPAWSQVPEANAFWYNPDAPRLCEGLTQEERLAESTRILTEAGWTWDQVPVWDADNLDALPKGEGLRGPDGTPVPELELLAPGPGYDPLRATYSLFVEEWAQDLGIPLTAEPTGFNVIVDAITDRTAPFDMYILGWSLTPFPDHMVDFFASSNDSPLGGNNYPGYANPRFDELAAEFQSTTDVEEARAFIKEMDAILAEERALPQQSGVPIHRHIEWPPEPARTPVVRAFVAMNVSSFD